MKMAVTGLAYGVCVCTRSCVKETDRHTDGDREVQKETLSTTKMDRNKVSGTSLKLELKLIFAYQGSTVSDETFEGENFCCLCGFSINHKSFPY